MNYNKLKEAIKSSKIQRKDIALGANITPKTVDNILAGGDPKVSTLEAIARVVGIKMSVLFDEEIIEENIEVRKAGRDYVEKGKIEHNGNKPDGSTSATDYRDEIIAQLRSQLADKERIIKLMESR